MKKIICLFTISLFMIILTGCSDDETNKYDLYKYTSWKTTDGYVLQLLEDRCLVGKDGKANGNVCKFEPNASDSGVGLITLCNSYGNDCEKTELYYNMNDLSRSSIYIYGMTFHYTGTVAKD